MKAQSQAIVIKNTSLFVGENGELLATEDFKRFFPIDGFFHVDSKKNDIIILDNICPYQITKDEIQRYYKVVCDGNEATDGNNGTENSDNSEDKGINYYELEESEDVEQFLQEIDAYTKGCAFNIVLFILCAILFFLIIK